MYSHVEAHSKTAVHTYYITYCSSTAARGAVRELYTTGYILYMRGPNP